MTEFKVGDEVKGVDWAFEEVDGIISEIVNDGLWYKITDDLGIIHSCIEVRKLTKLEKAMK